jgi:hypothetical protein
MEMATRLDYRADLSAVVIRANGTREQLGVISRSNLKTMAVRMSRFFKKLVRAFGLGAACLILAGLVRSGYLNEIHLWVLGMPAATGLVTTAGVNYMASDFASGGVTPTISGMKFHDSGTGVTAAAIGDTALQTPTGNARVTGTPSNPSANVYRTVATLPYTGGAAITEWGVFSASTSGTLWDHRVFSAINVANGDSIQFTYSLTIAAGGS